MRNSCLTLAAAVTIVRGFPDSKECLPRNTGWIIDPRFFRLGVTAVSRPLLDDVTARFVQACISLIQLIFVIDLNTEVIQTGGSAARRDGEIHARIIEHPLGIV